MYLIVEKDLAYDFIFIKKFSEAVLLLLFKNSRHSVSALMEIADYLSTLNTRNVKRAQTHRNISYLKNKNNIHASIIFMLIIK